MWKYNISNKDKKILLICIPRTVSMNVFVVNGLWCQIRLFFVCLHLTQKPVEVKKYLIHPEMELIFFTSGYIWLFVIGQRLLIDNIIFCWAPPSPWTIGRWGKSVGEWMTKGIVVTTAITLIKYISLYIISIFHSIRDLIKMFLAFEWAVLGWMWLMKRRRGKWTPDEYES